MRDWSGKQWLVVYLVVLSVVLSDSLGEDDLDCRDSWQKVQASETGRVIALAYTLYAVRKYEKSSNDVPSQESSELERFKAGGLFVWGD